MFRIGIDFDNTIVNYDKVFRFLLKKFYKINTLKKSKKEIRKIIIKDKGERAWMTLQGQAYGKYMYTSEISIGFKNFLHRAIINNSKIFIVSHKTDFGHYDKAKINLRKKSYEWIEKNINSNEKYKILKKNIFFLSTIDKKINKVKKLKLDFFIDDLEIILNNKDFPKSTKKILYNTSINKNDYKNYIYWRDISHYIFGKETKKELTKWVEKTSNYKIKKIIHLKGQKNSKVYRLTTSSNNNYLLKYYPDPKNDIVNRAENEFNSLKFMKANSLNVPKPIFLNLSLNYAIYEFIEGNKIIKIRKNYIHETIIFLMKLQNIKKTRKIYFQNAKESCLGIDDLFNQINNKYLKLFKINKKIKNLKLNKFLHEFNIIKRNIFKLISKKFTKTEISKKLPFRNQIIHPADFGFHNSLKSKQYIYFIDFEYLGYDDPVKLICDFYWHPGMKLDKKLSKLWLLESIKAFHYKNIDIKVKFLLNAYGLRWSLIILNDFVNNFENNVQNHSNEYYNNQLRKSFQIIRRIKTEKNIT